MPWSARGRAGIVGRKMKRQSKKQQPVTETTANNPASVDVNNSLPIRVLLLAIWVALFDLWLTRHFRSGVGANEIFVLVGVPAASLVSVGVVDFLLGEEWRVGFFDAVKAYIRGFIARHLSYSVIATLYIGSLIPATVYSTVSIDATAGGDRSVLLESVVDPDDRHSLTTTRDQPLDIGLWINPFAADYRLTVAGYLPAIVSAKPFVGRLVIPENDLVALPTVLFRPDPASYKVLGNRGSFHIYRKTGNVFVELTRDQGMHAWYLGPRRNQPADLRTEWQIDFNALNFQANEAAILMKRWRNPKRLDGLDIGPGQIICALVSNIDGDKFVAGVVGRIGKQEYIDFSLGVMSYDTDSAERDKSGPDLCAWLDSGAG